MAITFHNKKGLPISIVIAMVILIIIGIFIFAPSMQSFVQTMEKDAVVKKSQKAYDTAIYSAVKYNITIAKMAYYDDTYLVLYDDTGKKTITSIDTLTDTIPVGYVSYIDSNINSVVYDLGQTMADLIPISEVEKCAFNITT